VSLNVSPASLNVRLSRLNFRLVRLNLRLVSLNFRLVGLNFRRVSLNFRLADLESSRPPNRLMTFAHPNVTSATSKLAMRGSPLSCVVTMLYLCDGEPASVSSPTMTANKTNLHVQRAERR
jgi:hypothetical protein